ncbi:MAG: hypothetical protein ACJ71D_07365 [Nitrososphaera sp.]
MLDSFNTFTTSDGLCLTDEQYQSDAYINLASDGQMFTGFSIIGCKYSNLDCEDMSRTNNREIECRLLFKYALLSGAYLLYVFLKSFEPGLSNHRLPSTDNRKRLR